MSKYIDIYNALNVFKDKKSKKEVLNYYNKTNFNIVFLVVNAILFLITALFSFIFTVPSFLYFLCVLLSAYISHLIINLNDKIIHISILDALYKDDAIKKEFNKDFVRLMQFIDENKDDSNYQTNKFNMDVFNFINEHKRYDLSHLESYFNNCFYKKEIFNFEYIKKTEDFNDDAIRLRVIQNLTGDVIKKVSFLIDFYRENNILNTIDIDYKYFNQIYDKYQNSNLIDNYSELDLFKNNVDLFMITNGHDTNKISEMLNIKNIFDSKDIQDSIYHQDFKKLEKNFNCIKINDIIDFKNNLLQKYNL